MIHKCIFHSNYYINMTQLIKTNGIRSLSNKNDINNWTDTQIIYERHKNLSKYLFLKNLEERYIQILNKKLEIHDNIHKIYSDSESDNNNIFSKKV